MKISDRHALHMALTNRDKALRNHLLKKYNLLREFAELNVALRDIEKRMVKLGLIDEAKLLPDYFPRMIADMDGYISESEKKGEVGRGFVGKEVNGYIDWLEGKGIPTSNADRAQIITNLLASGTFRHIPLPGSSKERKVDQVGLRYLRYYKPINDVVLSHIRESVEAIGKWELIGKTDRMSYHRDFRKPMEKIEKVRKSKKAPSDDDKLKMAGWHAEAMEALTNLNEKNAEIEQAVSAYIATAIPSDERGDTGERQKIAIELLRSRLMQRGPGEAVSVIRDIGYIATIGNVFSAITQLGDHVWSFYKNGHVNTLSAMGKVMKLAMTEEGRKKLITAEHFDLVQSTKEFSQAKTTKALDFVLKWSGLKAMDIFGKETFLRATIEKVKSQSYAQFKKGYGKFFEGSPTQEAEIKQAYNSLRKDVLDNDALKVLFFSLSEFQPITLSSMPKHYLTSKNGRILYMLKTYQLKQINNIIREYKKNITQDQHGSMTKGITQMVGLLFALSMAGATTDALKDILMGRELDDLDDTLVENFVQIWFINKYATERGFSSGKLVSAVLGNQLPPMRHADHLLDDLIGLTPFKEFEFKTMQDIPLLGKLVRETVTPYGAKDKLTYGRLDALDAIRESVVGGSISKSRKKVQKYNKQVRKYNSSKRKEDWVDLITPFTMRRIRKQSKENK